MTVPWEHAGGPNECPHGYAEGVPCPYCNPAPPQFMIEEDIGPTPGGRLRGIRIATAEDLKEAVEMDKRVRALGEAAMYLVWLCTEHARLSEPEDLGAIRGVQDALVALGWTITDLVDDGSDEEEEQP